MVCKYFRKRQKNYQDYFYCELKKKEISYTCYENCKKWESRKVKPINKVSKKREFVKSSTYEQVLERDKTCRLADGTCMGGLQLHHIQYRSERKDLINEPSNCIMLCMKHHKEVHRNKDYWQEKLMKKLEGI